MQSFTEHQKASGRVAVSRTQRFKGHVLLSHHDVSSRLQLCVAIENEMSRTKATECNTSKKQLHRPLTFTLTSKPREAFEGLGT